MATDLAIFNDDQLREILVKLAEEHKRITAELERRTMMQQALWVRVVQPSPESQQTTIYVYHLN